MIRHQFGTEEHGFLLRVGEWRDVEKACDAGLGEIASRIAPLVALVDLAGTETAGGLMQAITAGGLGRLRLDDVRAPILHGLIGGGRTSTEAGALVKKVFDEAV
ncbi:MAG: gene transfer agent family protein, partial [Phenylobacterium sp.]|nr:gene transfer agent family protein [Phenylobacterium sp.]